MHELDGSHIALLTVIALVAGTLDAIAGGGGLLSLPALLWSGLPPHIALATNKGQAVFGSFAAVVRFARGEMIDGARARIAVPLAMAGSLVGARLLLALSPAALRPAAIALLAGAAIVIGLGRTPTPAARAPPPFALPIAASIALVLGTYDGFFGPGTGTFLIVAFTALLGDNLTRASADAKVVNFSSNLAAMALFASRGVIVWRIALPMAAAQFAGGWLGAHLVLRRGDTLVRRIAVAVALALAAKLAVDLRA